MNDNGQQLSCSGSVPPLFNLSDQLQHFRSATALKPLTGNVNNSDYLVTMQCSVGTPWVLTLPLDPSKHWIYYLVFAV